MKIEEKELEECSYMDEEFFGVKGNIVYDLENESLNLPLLEKTVDSENLQLFLLEKRIDRLSERLDKIEEILEWRIDD